MTRPHHAVHRSHSHVSQFNNVTLQVLLLSELLERRRWQMQLLQSDTLMFLDEGEEK